MRQKFITTLVLCALSTQPVWAQTSDPSDTGQTTSSAEQSQTEARPQERDLTEMADGGEEWVQEYTSSDGEELYQSLCSGCHMTDGAGAVGAGAYPALRDNPNLEYAGYATYIIVNGQKAMPSLGHFLDDEQVVAITDYLQTNLDNDYDPDGTVEAVAGIRPAEPVNQNTEEHE